MTAPGPSLPGVAPARPPRTPIVVTGASGFLGRHLLPVLEQRYGAGAVVALSSADYDLLDPAAHRRMFAETRPGTLVHLAAHSGGLGANLAAPADFFHRNALLTTLAFALAAEHGVGKVLYPMGGCSYPAEATSPIGEDQMWAGYPHPSSAGYSMAKKMGIVAAHSYRAQHGLDTAVVVPGNMYGPHDNFREGESHVIPALVRRFVEAREAGAPRVALWGTGSPRRDFVYAGDVAAALPFFLEHDVGPEPTNVCTGRSTSIRELARLVREATGYGGELVWDPERPEGQQEKIFSPARLHELGPSCPTPLAEGLRRTVAWFEERRAAGEGVRL